MNNNCDCSGSNVINNLLQNPNNSISNLGTNMGGNVGHGNLGGMDSMGFNLGMDYGNSPPVNNVTNYGTTFSQIVNIRYNVLAFFQYWVQLSR